jgi:hypothetical protein
MGEIMDHARQLLRKRHDLWDSIQPGSSLWWRGVDGRERGPVDLQGTFQDGSTTWCWFVDEEGVEHLMSTCLITQVKPRQ